MKDRRKRKRKNLLEKASATILSPPELSSGSKQIYFSFTQDVSLDGIKIITDTLLPENTMLGIKLLITETQKTLKLKGKVKWAKKYHDKELYETGLEFLDTSHETILALMEYIYKKEEKSS